MKNLKVIDLFCGIGGFRIAMTQAVKRLGINTEFIFASDIDPFCQDAYEANFGHRPIGDITLVDESSISDFDVLLAGFPCQAFSIIGNRKGFEDIRGTLFFDIARILRAKRPSLFVLENVKQLRGHNKGETLRVILEVLDCLGYNVKYQVLNALDFGLPQKRERIWIVGSLKSLDNFNFPTNKMPMQPLEEILEKEVDKKYFASEHIRNKRLSKKEPNDANETTVWHENKSGNISVYPYSCALRANASYNYLLVNGKRRLTTREMLRLQGFPDDFKIACNERQTRKQAGNSLPVNVAREVIYCLLSNIN